MYRLSTPNLLIFILLVAIGIILTSLTPNYFGATRILSFISLAIGELGMSFIPVIALYPKASPLQAILLALIFFITTFTMCVAAWGINSFGWPGDYAFQWKDGEFYVNTYALFVSNIISLASLILNFKLIYDEELTKEKHKNAKYKRSNFKGFKKSLLKRPLSSEFKQPTPQATSKERSPSPSRIRRENEEEDFGKPFDFTSDEVEVSEDKLPEESSGSLFSKEDTFSPPQDEDTFFSSKPSAIKLEDPPFESLEEHDEDLPFSEERPKSLFEDLTATKEKIEKPEPIKLEGSLKVPSDIKNDLAAIFEQYSSLNAVKKLTSDISEKYISNSEKRFRRERNIERDKNRDKERVKISISDDVHEASYRPVSEKETMKEIKESLKGELKDELIESLKSELKREIADEKINLEIKEDLDELKKKLSLINRNQKILGSLFLTKTGEVVTEEWNDINSKSISGQTIADVFNVYSTEISKTNQGGLNHLLLESKKGTIILVEYNNKILTILSEGTGEIYTGQILRTLSEIEEE